MDPVASLSFIIDSKSAENLAKIQPKVKGMPILNNIYVDVGRTNMNGSAHFRATDLDSVSNPEIKKMDCTFPPYKNVIPKQEGVTLTMGFNVNYMKEVCDIASKMGLEGCKFEFTDANSPVKITGTTSEGQEFMALVMPIRL